MDIETHLKRAKEIGQDMDRCLPKIDLSPIAPCHPADRDAIALEAFKLTLETALSEGAFGKQPETEVCERIALIALSSTDAFIAARGPSTPVGLGGAGAIDYFFGVTEGLRQAVAVGEEVLRTTAGPTSHAAVTDYIRRIKEVIEARK